MLYNLQKKKIKKIENEQVMTFSISFSVATLYKVNSLYVLSDHVIREVNRLRLCLWLRLYYGYVYYVYLLALVLGPKLGKCIFLYMDSFISFSSNIKKFDLEFQNQIL